MDSYRVSQNIKEFDLQTILSSYDGHTIFSLFEDKVKILEKILEMFQDNHNHYPLEFDEIYRLPVENSAYRRLIQLLKAPTLMLDS